MSRSSKGFADFFPTAPSVLQQKRSRSSQPSKDPAPPLSSDSQKIKPPPSLSSTHGAENIKPPSQVIGAKRNVRPNQQQNSSHEENEAVQPDFTHEVGSASSTSTTESVFSSNQKGAKVVQGSGQLNSTNVTPLTNIDSSPRTNGRQSPAKKSSRDHYSATGLSPGSPYGGTNAKLTWPTDVKVEENSQQTERQIRPGKGLAKGYKITYDPTTDRSAKSKSREPSYDPFGLEVCNAESRHMNGSC